MRELSDSDIRELKVRNYLEDDGHPSTEAFKQIFLSLSADFDRLAKKIEEHGRDCPICGIRYQEASLEIMRLRKKQL